MYYWQRAPIGIEVPLGASRRTVGFGVAAIRAFSNVKFPVVMAHRRLGRGEGRVAARASSIEVVGVAGGRCAARRGSAPSSPAASASA